MQDKPIKLPEGVSTETMLMEIHRELSDRLISAHGKPVFITVTYREGDMLRHWCGDNGDFPKGDLLPSLVQIAENVKRDMIKPIDAAVADMRKQLKVKRKRK